jgi:hypothetical protein
VTDLSDPYAASAASLGLPAPVADAGASPRATAASLPPART